MDGNLMKFITGVEAIQKNVSSQYPQINRNSNKARVIENLRNTLSPVVENVKDNEELML